MIGQDTDVNKSVAQLATLIVNMFMVFKSTLYIYLHQIYELHVYIFCDITCILIFTFSPFTINVQFWFA